MRKCIFLMSCFLLLSLVGASAQTAVSGKVISKEDGQPVIGATVKVKNTGKGTITGVSGDFKMQLPDNSSVLIISYVGMKPVEMAAKQDMVVTLESNTAVLDEVMVVAYGKTKKSSFTGSAGTVNARSLEKRTISTVSSALEGNVSGVQVSSSLGQPGSDAAIRIRGFGSVNASNSPLYVVDGAPFSGRLSDINPSDIESLTILKDGAATAIYGSSAGNGVVLVTTKKASGAASVTLNISQGWSTRAYKDYATVGVKDYYPLQWRMLKNSYVSAGKTEAEAAALASGLKSATGSDGIFDKLKYNPFAGVADDAIVGAAGLLTPNAKKLKWGDDLNWADYAFRTGHRQEYTLSYSTKNTKSDTYASIGYLNDKGYMINTDFERYTGRVNYNIYPVKWFKSGLNVGLGRIISNYSVSNADNSGAYSNLTRFVRNMAPIYPVHKHDLATGEYLNAKGMATSNPSEYIYDYDGQRQSDPGRDALVETLWNKRELGRANTNARTYVTITPIKGLELTSNYALDLSDLRSRVYENPKVGDGTAGPARLNITSGRSTTQNFNQLIAYNRKSGKHTLDVLLGHESYKYTYEYLNAMKTGEIIPGVNEFGNFVNINSTGSYTDTYTKEGYFSRVNYDYAGKYYGSVSYRRDGSSRFSPDTRWGNFWSFGGSWRMSEEQFMKDYTWVDNLKLRASYGETGNDAVGGYYPYQTLYNLGVNNSSEAGAFFNTLANKELKWETQVSKDLALEFQVFRKLSGTVEFFRKESKDLLFDVAMATSNGIASMTQNIGKVRNEGLELELNYTIVKNKQFTLSVGGNATLLRNRILRLPAGNREKGIVSGSKKFMEGHSVYDFWLRQWYGVDKNTGNGLYYLDTQAYNDANGTMSAAVKKSLVTGEHGEQLTNSFNYAKFDFSGESMPKMYGGFNVNAEYKGFDFAALFSYALGGKVLDSNYQTLMSMSAYGAGMGSDVAKAWQKPGDVTDVPRMDNNAVHAQSIGQIYSTRWLVSGNYLNFRSLTLGYTIPSTLLKSIDLKSARFSINAENLFMLTARQGLNPQGQYSGITYNEYQPAKSITLGLKVTF